MCVCQLTFRSRWTTLFWCRKETPSRICLISLFTSPSLKASSSRSDTHWLKISPPAALRAHTHTHTHTQRDGGHQSTTQTLSCKNIVDPSALQARVHFLRFVHPKMTLCSAAAFPTMQEGHVLQVACLAQTQANT